MTDLGWLDAIEARYGSETSGPNWQAEDYADGPAKDALLNRAKEDARRLVSALREAQAKVERVEALAADFDGGQYNIICRLIRAALADPKETE